MLDDRRAKTLYKNAEKMVLLTPRIGKLAGHCTTVSHGMLSFARELDSDATIAVGWVTVKGVDLFKFTPEQFDGWLSGTTQERYRLHCWLVLPTLSDVLDLTLPATLREIDPKKYSSIPSFLTMKSAVAHQVVYHSYREGENILHELNTDRR